LSSEKLDFSGGGSRRKHAEAASGFRKTARTLRKAASHHLADVSGCFPEGIMASLARQDQDKSGVFLRAIRIFASLRSAS